MFITCSMVAALPIVGFIPFQVQMMQSLNFRKLIEFQKVKIALRIGIAFQKVKTELGVFTSNPKTNPKTVLNKLEFKWN